MKEKLKITIDADKIEVPNTYKSTLNFDLTMIERIFEKNIISYKDIQNAIVPVIKGKKVFISYSHKDTTIAKYIAEKLIDDGISVFIDCEFWNNTDEILKMYDDKFCKNKGENTYNYKSRNYSTAMMHCILASSIIQCINNCDCFLYIKTENADPDSNESPWVYLENLIVNQKSENLTENFNRNVIFPLDLTDFIVVDSIVKLRNKIKGLRA